RDERRDMLHFLKDVIFLAQEQRLPPKRLVAAADEEPAKDHARESRAERQPRQRDQHHGWRLMYRMIAMAVLVVAMIVLRLGRQRSRPFAALAEEGHEQEAPSIERGEGGRDVDAPERVSRAKSMRGEGGLDDRVLRHEAGEADRGKRNADAGQGQRA